MAEWPPEEIPLLEIAVSPEDPATAARRRRSEREKAPGERRTSLRGKHFSIGVNCEAESEGLAYAAPHSPAFRFASTLRGASLGAPMLLVLFFFAYSTSFPRDVVHISPSLGVALSFHFLVEITKRKEREREKNAVLPFRCLAFQALVRRLGCSYCIQVSLFVCLPQNVSIL